MCQRPGPDAHTEIATKVLTYKITTQQPLPKLQDPEPPQPRHVVIIGLICLVHRVPRCCVGAENSGISGQIAQRKGRGGEIEERQGIFGAETRRLSQGKRRLLVS